MSHPAKRSDIKTNLNLEENRYKKNLNLENFQRRRCTARPASVGSPSSCAEVCQDFFTNEKFLPSHRRQPQQLCRSVSRLLCYSTSFTTLFSIYHLGSGASGRAKFPQRKRSLTSQECLTCFYHLGSGASGRAKFPLLSISGRKWAARSCI